MGNIITKQVENQKAFSTQNTSSEFYSTPSSLQQKTNIAEKPEIPEQLDSNSKAYHVLPKKTEDLRIQLINIFQGSDVLQNEGPIQSTNYTSEKMNSSLNFSCLSALRRQDAPVLRGYALTFKQIRLNLHGIKEKRSF